MFELRKLYFDSVFFISKIQYGIRNIYFELWKLYICSVLLKINYGCESSQFATKTTKLTSEVRRGLVAAVSQWVMDGRRSRGQILLGFGEKEK